MRFSWGPKFRPVTWNYTGNLAETFPNFLVENLLTQDAECFGSSKVPMVDIKESKSNL